MRLASILAWLIILGVCLLAGSAVICLQVALYDTTKNPSALWMMATLLFLAACTIYLSWRDAREAVRKPTETKWEAEIKRPTNVIPLNQRRA